MTPHRMDGLPFHDFMLAEAARPDTTGAALVPDGRGLKEKPRTRFDLSNYAKQRCGHTAIVCYTLLIAQGTSAGVRVISYNESRVIVKFPEDWKVVHVHKSPAWNAPFQPLA